MKNTLKKRIDYRYQYITSMIEQIEERIKSYPEGRIHIKHNKSKPHYYLLVGEHCGIEKSIRNDDVLIEQLLQKQYLEEVQAALKNESDLLKRIKRKYPETIAEDIYEGLSDDRKKYIKPIVPTDEQFIERWQNEPYTPKPISDDVPKYKTKRGEWVRSKSEALIADRLFAAGIPYKYECPLTFKVDDRLVTIHPDFTILRVSDRKMLYLEHCGKMGDPEYVEEMVNRVNDYIKGGIYQGDRLFFTFETSKTPLDLEVLDKMIEKNFR